MKRFIYVFSLFACVAVGFLIGTAYTERSIAYMDSERALTQYFKAGEKRGTCISNRMHLKMNTADCFGVNEQ